MNGGRSRSDCGDVRVRHNCSEMRSPLALARRRAYTRSLERRQIFIEGYSFPLPLRDKIRAHLRPKLRDHQVSLVLEALRTWFLACLYARGKLLGMPSHAVDVAWHEFILMTRHYHAFCNEALGRYLHHAPDSTLPDHALGDALRRTLEVLEEHELDAPDEEGVPLLFALDAKLGIEGGYVWTAAQVEVLRQRSGGAAGGGGCGGGDGRETGCGASCGGGGCGGGGCGGG